MRSKGLGYTGILHKKAPEIWHEFLKCLAIHHRHSIVLKLLMKLIFQENNFDFKDANEEPLRLELFSSDQMDQHSKSLASTHKINEKSTPDRLLKRLAENEKVLLEVHALLTSTIKDEYQVTPAGEWLLDNFYLIEEQIQIAKRHLPKLYSEGLPQLANGSAAGLPRVYDIALEIVSHSDGRLDMETLNNFVRSYQSVTHLQIGELWGVPIMLRLALIENLRRVSASIAAERIHRNQADYWSKLMLNTIESNPKDLILVIADMARSNPPLERSFVAEITRQLRGKGPSVAQALTWLEDRLSESGYTSNELVQAENQKQAADQLTVSNSINSLRSLGTMNWKDFVESNSIVEQTLHEDEVYVKMDFHTRDRYRHVIEAIAKNARKTELAVTKTALNLAAQAGQVHADKRFTHVGYYLIGDGVHQTEIAAGMHISFGEKVRRFFARHPLSSYLMPVILLTIGLTGVIVWEVWRVQSYNIPLLITIGIVTAVSASQLGVALINFLCTLTVKPDMLPRMDFAKGIPDDAMTMVAIPCMITSEDEIEKLTEALEIRYLANQEENLYFALLTDFKDAPQEHMPEDEELIKQTVTCIENLNRKYKRGKYNVFYLFHRPRLWNAMERVWMGHERKRGKLSDLNGLLRGEANDKFSTIIGDQSILASMKYVLTLDADTQLPRDTAWKIVATMAHPLNRAVYDEKKRRVTEGYGILQPRVSISMPRAESSSYAHMNGNEPGIDPYTRLTSDVYQDLFQEGSFIGKGIYEVDIFEKALKDRFPENRILSHDLLEGCYIRSGLLSDIQLYEKYPSLYSADMKRRHRWIRGDWQIAAWCLPWVPGGDKRWRKNPLNALSRWKILDNLRRSLFPGAVTTLIVLSWMFLPDAGWWTLIISGIIILPGVVSNFWNVMRKPKDVILIHHVILSSRSAGSSAVSNMFTLICLPYEAFMNMDAILRSCWRMLISHRHLLEWNPSGFTENNSSNQLWSSYLSMISEPVSAVGVIIYLSYFHSPALYVAGPILALWLIAPTITWAVSQPVTRKLAELNYEQNIFLQKLTRKTWAFFEEFVTEADNWLPPDNFQEQPVSVIAHRTSPTNIGLSLLSTMTAYDFSYITTGQMLTRLGQTMTTMQKMERHKGHFYNWYDTETLSPLHPRYISSVDSGNLGGHLLTLRQGLLGLPHQQIVGTLLFESLRNTLRILADTVGKKDFSVLKQFKTELENVCSNLPTNLTEVKGALDVLYEKFQIVSTNLQTDKNSQTYFWKLALEAQIAGPLEELQKLAPWLYLAPAKQQYVNYNNNTITIPTLSELTKYELIPVEGDESEWLNSYNAAISAAKLYAQERIALIENLANHCNDFADMEWDFLYDKNKRLLTIGYNVDEHRIDGSSYDLLASEARLAVFLAIAQGKIPQESWFALGRLLLNVDGNPILLSWSGSMFEYLMPMLVMPTYDNTLINQTDKSSVQRQIQYGKERGVPWGISECCYNTIDAAQNYQYRAFGVPGLGLKRGLGEDLVIAPYASVMALMVSPEKSCSNLLQLSSLGFEGKYGMYEAIDYTSSRLPRGQSFALVQTYMAHHQGMSLLSLSHLLLGQPMPKRFEEEPQFQATLLLLEERIPKATSFYQHTTDTADAHSEVGGSEVRIIRTPNTPVPEVQLLSNGKYHVMVTNAGGGYSKWKNIAVTRWREDVTSDNWGTFCYIRDLETGSFWSTAHQPTLNKSKNYEVAFSQGRADFRDRQNEIETHTEIVVSPEDDIEMRRVHITNRSGRRKYIDITSYSEVVIAPAAADAAHPAFSNLFVQTEILKAQNAIICSRRPRGENDKEPWLFHLMKMHGKDATDVSYETDRSQFIGRGNTVASPNAMTNTDPLSGNQGPVLDPIVSIRYQVMIDDDETLIIDMLLGMTETREASQALIDKYQDKHHNDRVFELAWTHNQVVLRQINASESEAQLYSRLAGSVLYINPALRSDPATLIKNRKGQSGLWPYSISGDLPIVLLRVEETTNVDLIKQLIQAHVYWRMKGLAVDLVIWNESHGGYRQALQNQIMSLIATQSTEQSGGIFVRGADQVPPEDTVLMQTVARICISGADNSLLEFINRKGPAKVAIPYIIPTQTYSPATEINLTKETLILENGFGGFSNDGKEYIIEVSDKQRTPAPWVNVLANPDFGTVISESGQAYTWSENAHEYRLTPWNNDPITDQGGEAFYVRDEETGHYWSATPLPRISRSPYKVRHGFGYSVFEHMEAGIQSEMWVYVDIAATIKYTVLKLKNLSGRPRKISVTGYADWVLGDLKPKTSMYIATELDTDTGALIAKNAYSTEFAERVAFFDTDEPNKSYTGSRTEFIGRNFSLRNPDAMSRLRLSGKMGMGADPCAAIQVSFDLSEYQDREIVFRLGAGKNYNDAMNTIRQFKGKDKATEALNKVRAYWEHTVSAIQIETPDKALNILANGWLIYQSLACRVWARSGLYQSGGAFGFRDQLQDAMSLLYTEPGLARKQILLHASKQFREGDVLHWWHPPVGRGVRTHCSDDYLWLPFVTATYLSNTEDKSILDEMVTFIEGRILNPEEESNYDLPAQSGESAALYDHCVRAIKRGLSYGEHGLPLIGTGDWNDGMDQVGKHGKGESVWLSFFLLDILKKFKSIATARNDESFAEICDKEAVQLQSNIEKNAWDGEWYRRAYFDNGNVLGSSANEECRIDSIAQSWSVLAGDGDTERKKQAMDSAYKYLVSKEDRLIKLLYPPFDKSNLEPGYIKGYVPGVRENGGQYTHAAIWLIMAFAKLKRNDLVWELLTMINPINHGNDADQIAVYKVEPYVVAGDVYAQSHIGQGGWTWYSGSAGWFYRLIIESVIGMRKEGNSLHFEPCVPSAWNTFKMDYRYKSTTYSIILTKGTAAKISVSLDGVSLKDGIITLVDDGTNHKVEIGLMPIS
ncbi:MAG: glycosyltransferase [Bacteroidetes bacterium]|nr:glycosyltransferase [Bacteroidota bacterium]